MTNRRLIEEAFPLKEVSEHSKHEKNVRHGHISTLHIWPARRPLAACRAAIIAALLPDPGDEQSRHELTKKITSITKWKTENGPALDYFREEIRKAYGGRAPKVLDMFAGGGAIPLEAMRLGCDVTAIDYNPVAWFILKCTLEFPQRLAGKTWPLPADAPQLLRSLSGNLDDMGESDGDGDDETDISTPMAEAPVGDPQLSLFAVTDEAPAAGNLADHVRYWGAWVLEKARIELAPYYPTVDCQPAVAYLWARTVPCPDPKCGCTIPLLTTLWLSKKPKKILPDTPANRARADFISLKQTKNTSKVVINGYRALRMILDYEMKLVRFEVTVPPTIDFDSSGTMSGATSKCPLCGINVTVNYIKQCGAEGKLGKQMTSVIVDTEYGRDYRSPTDIDVDAVQNAMTVLSMLSEQLPGGIPYESMPGKDRHRAVGSQLPEYGFQKWSDIFTERQLAAIAVYIKLIRTARCEMASYGYPTEWTQAIQGYLALILDRLVAQTHTLCLPDPSPTQSGIKNPLAGFTLPMTWDFIEGATTSDASGSFYRAIDWVTKVIELLCNQLANVPKPEIRCANSAKVELPIYDAIVTDPPYYDAIPYSDLSDFFYVWLKRTLDQDYEQMFSAHLTPKEDELVQQKKSGTEGKEGKRKYETGMFRVFQRSWEVLDVKGRMVLVFAHKELDAWESLLSALIQAGFTVTASWPIDTERETRVRSVNAASLASSIWLVCRKRSTDAGTGRYRAVRKAMEERVAERLRYFWDIGLSGPDFVWAAIGPALESYSSYAEVKRLDGSPFTVGEFLKEVRRMVADFTLGRILQGQSTEGLDEWTRYYLMHRSDFGLEAAPVGECILLSQGYGIDLNELRSDRGYIRKASGSDIRLAKWDERERSDLGELHPSGGLPLIDMLHRLMHLWAAGSLDKLNGYAAERGLRQNDLFWAVAQAILEMADAKSRERTLLEALVAWGRGQTTSTAAPAQPSLLVN